MTIVQHADEGEVLVIGPTTTIVKVPGDATGGRLSVVEMHLPANWEGPPLHQHERVEHIWYVFAGRIMFHIGDRMERCSPGACAYVPAGMPHTFNTAGCPASTLLEMDTPQPLDGYFRDLVDAFPPGAPVDPARVGEIMRRHDTRPI